MPNNHFELNTDGFNSLLDNLDESQRSSSEGETTPVEVNIPDNTTEEILESSSSEGEPTNFSEPKNDDFILSFLNEYGLKDGKVTYETEEGGTEEVSFNDLDSEEKINILKSLTSPNLSKDEIEVINYLRENNATIQDVITYYSQKAVEDYIKENGEIPKQYSVDEYSDEEIYTADLKSKFPDMTDDDIKADLEIAKENEELFKKKVDIIRNQYKAKEEKEATERANAQKEQFDNFKNALSNQLSEFNEISMDYKDSRSQSLEIEDSEKEEIYRYILNQDENGETQFFKDLNNPKMLVELAWFALYGKDAISDISNYWKSQLKNARKSETKSQTTIIPRDNNKKDGFISHHKSIETKYGEDLL